MNTRKDRGIDGHWATVIFAVESIEFVDRFLIQNFANDVIIEVEFFFLFRSDQRALASWFHFPVRYADGIVVSAWRLAKRNCKARLFDLLANNYSMN